MAKEYYDQPITDTTDWGGDRSTGGKQVKGNRVQEWIKDKVSTLESGESSLGGRVTAVEEFDTEAGERLDTLEGKVVEASEESIRDIVKNWTPDVEPEPEPEPEP